MSCHDDILMGAFHLLLPPFPKVARLLPMGLATFSWGETWGVGEWWWGVEEYCWEFLVGFLLRGSSNLDPVFRPCLQNPYPFQDLAFKKLCHHFLD